MSHRIDWKRYFAQAAATLRTDRGGLMRIRGDEGAAASLFAELLRADLVASGWAAPRLEMGAQDGATIDELLATLIDRLGCKLESTPDARIGAERIEAGGSVIFQNNSISLTADVYTRAERRAAAKQTIRASIEERLAKGNGFALLLTNEIGSSALAREFWIELWPEFFEDLVRKGLRIIDACRGALPVTAPLPDCIIDLPSSYSPEDEAVAVEDMVTILTSIVGPSDDLRVVCRTVMVSAARRPETVHTLFQLNVLDQQMREPS